MAVHPQNNSQKNPWGQGFDPTADFSLGMNMGTLSLGTQALGAFNQWQENRARDEANDIARQELAFNKDAWQDNFTMQMGTINDERARVNAFTGPGGFLSESQYIAPYDENKFGSLRDLQVG